MAVHRVLFPILFCALRSLFYRSLIIFLRQQRLARYLAARIDRDTSAEDQQLTIWSNESMKSSAFEGFHLSDNEYGLRLHHDRLRRFLPVALQELPPDETEMQARNTERLGTT